LKKSYDLFRSSAMAYCISMLLAMSLGSISKSLAAQKYTVAYCSFNTDRIFSFGYDNNSYFGKKDTKNKTADLHGQNFKNNYPDAGSYFFYENSSLITLYKPNTNFQYIGSQNDQMVRIQNQKSKLPSIENSKDLKGFNCIIKVPDKLS